MRRTSDSNAIDVVRHDSLALDDTIQLGTSTVEDDRVEADTVKEAETRGEFVNLVEDGTSDLDDRKFCGVGGIGGRRKDAKVTFDLALGTDGVE